MTEKDRIANEYERIWLRSRNEPFNPSARAFYTVKVDDRDIEYVRADLLSTARDEVWQEAIETVQQSVKKSQAAKLDVASAEIAIKRLESARAKAEDKKCPRCNGALSCRMHHRSE